MATQSFQLDEFKKGDFLIWSVCTQAQLSSKVSMKAGDHQVFSVSKDNPSTNLQFLGQNSYDLTTDDYPILTVEVYGSSKILQSKVTDIISDNKARSVGYSYSICIEDSTDSDYNDIYINVTGWRTKG